MIRTRDPQIASLPFNQPTEIRGKLTNEVQIIHINKK